MTTLYDTLSVPEDATAEEIKRAYRKAVMRWHPDRNVGQEHAARAAFLDIRNAYAILSDPAQRQVYDSVFAEEMKRQEEQRRREEQEQAEREAAARAAEEAEYASTVALAMRFATQGYNRDVVRGVLLGHGCDDELARRIADSALALHASRQTEVASAEPEDIAQETHGDQQEEDPVTTDRVRSFSDLWLPFWNVLRS
ncbi:J domain-containing protein [Caballeronia mineralivorans]|uniref:J domain-containing protein n=1 Tax=Caballeronia mineralivorans TaxID=2010198 RepID=UPI0023F30D73|nr:J domain-containing protein [Caballeronia mineralivorans]MDB5784406.1 Molecular chaperone DnaJ [Caballeronia mineralivorans]